MESCKRLKSLLIALILFFSIFFVPNTAFASKNEKADDPLDLLVGLSQTRGAEIYNEYRLKDTLTAAYGTVFKFEQFKGDFTVPSGEIEISVGNDGNVLSVFGGYEKVDCTTDVVISSDEAKAKVLGNVLGISKLIYDNEPSYEITTDFNGGYKFIVSGLSGKVLYASPISSGFLTEQIDYDGNTHSLDLHTEGNNVFLTDAIRNIIVMDANNTEGLQWMLPYVVSKNNGKFEPIAVSTYVSVAKAYDYFADENNIGVARKGIKGNNDDIPDNSEERGEAIIYVAMHYGRNIENAACQYSDGVAVLIVGDGNMMGSLYMPGKAADIIAHEYTHAISTEIAEFDNFNEVGAINEAVSDMFGALIEGHDLEDEEFWQMGEDAVAGGLSGLRDARGGTPNQAYSISERYPSCNKAFNVYVPPWDPSYHDHSTCDSGGVHLNCTIFTHAQYLMYQKLPEFFTKKTIGTLWYNTLLLLNKYTSFNSFAKKMYQTAVNLGYNDTQLEAVYYGLKEVGLDPDYTVTFLGYDGEVIEEQKVPYGKSAVCSTTPTKPSEGRYSYEFTGWDISPDNVTEDMTVTAQFEQKIRLFNVNFVDNNGETVLQKSLSNGETVILPDFASVVENSENFEFFGWFLDEERSVEAKDVVVSSDMTIYGKWEVKPEPEPVAKGLGCGSITFFDGGGGMIELLAFAFLALMPSVVLVSRRKSKR